MASFKQKVIQHKVPDIPLMPDHDTTENICENLGKFTSFVLSEPLLEELGTNATVKMAEEVEIMNENIHNICQNVEKKLTLKTLEKAKVHAQQKVTKCR